jgi:uncharacterized protein YgbK (DUF1537 family)
MKRMLVIADDLTGAGEIAGIAWHQHVPVRLLTGDAAEMPEPLEGLTIINTDTRNLERVEAEARIMNCLKQFDPERFELVYKKVDSLLRGQVLPEVLATMDWGGFSRTVLVPANPSRYRCIREGHYFVGPLPLHETEHRNDPEFPRISAAVLDLLKGDNQRVSIDPVDWDKRNGGVVVPDVRSREAIQEIVNTRIHGEDLLAGGADFFSVLLEEKAQGQSAFNGSGASSGSGGQPGRQFNFAIATIFIIGSHSGANRYDAERLKQSGYTVCQLSAGVVKTRNLPVADRYPQNSTFFTSDKLVISFPDAFVPDAAERESLLDEITELAVIAAKGRNEPVHFLVTGGRTASAFCRKMNWNELILLHAEAGGIATFKNPNSNHIITLKPGSYHWPASFM